MECFTASNAFSRFSQPSTSVVFPSNFLYSVKKWAISSSKALGISEISYTYLNLGSFTGTPSILSSLSLPSIILITPIGLVSMMHPGKVG